jgi:type IV secretory pathway VirD2 relaxase
MSLPIACTATGSPPCKDDRHFLRFLASPEHAVKAEDLRAFTGKLLADAERDLGTKLD